MGTDTECDLAIEAANGAERRAIADVRSRLIADHCGVGASDVAQVLQETGSLIVAAERLSRNGHSLQPVQDGDPQAADLASYIETVADPEQPIAADAFFAAVFGNDHRRGAPFVKLALGAALTLGLALAWRYTPLAAWADPEIVRRTLAAFAQNPWAPVVAISAFLVAGLLAFPVTILIAATAAAFGPGPGLLYATVGVLVSAAITYALGARLGREALRSVLGPRLNRIRRRIARRGILAVATIRLVPLAPFTVVNLVAGASAIRPVDFLAGTLLGMLPGLIVLSLLGHQVMRILMEPTLGDIALLVAAIGAWIAISVALQVFVAKWSKRP